MSYDTWAEEFYHTPAEYTPADPIVCLEHSILKWRGALPANLVLHDMKYENYCLADAQDPHWPKELYFDGNTCALCVHFSATKCPRCPIVKTTGRSCNVVWGDSSNTASPMLDLLQHVRDNLQSRKV